MKVGLGRYGWPIAVLTALACLGTAQNVHAGPVLEIRVGSNNQTFGQSTVISNTTLVEDPNESGRWTFSSGNSISLLEIDITVQTNAPGTPTLAELMTVTATLRDRGSGSNAREIYISVSDDRFTAPTGDNLQLQNITDSFSTSQGGPGPHTFSSFVLDSDSNTLASVVGQGFPTAGQDPTTGIADFSNYLTPFTLSNLTYVHITPNEEITTSGMTQVVAETAVVPEPSTIAMAFMGFVGWLGVKGVRRYRRRSVMELA